jgi:hypothetical protein
MDGHSSLALTNHAHAAPRRSSPAATRSLPVLVVGVRAHRRDGRLLLGGERVGDERLPRDDEGGHPTLVDDRLDLAHLSIVPHQPAGARAAAPLFAELLQSCSVA